VTPYVITVEFRLRVGALAAFLPLIMENARCSLTDEPGCRRFDVLVPDGAEDRIFLYEIYDDERAFEAHCASAHFHAFDHASRHLYEAKNVQRYKLTQNAAEHYVAATINPPGG
jgi:quinol monooxygenase YgiN